MPELILDKRKSRDLLKKFAVVLIESQKTGTNSLERYYAVAMLLGLEIKAAEKSKVPDDILLWLTENAHTDADLMAEKLLSNIADQWQE